MTSNPAMFLGANPMRKGFSLSDPNNAPFENYEPGTGASPQDACIYGSATAAAFHFSNQPLPAWQSQFARRLAALAQNHGCRLVLVHLPVLAEADDPAIIEKQFWPDFLQVPVTMVGIPPQKLFAGLTEKQSKLLYADPNHMNLNGQKYFTSLLTPSFEKIYESIPSH